MQDNGAVYGMHQQTEWMDDLMILCGKECPYNIHIRGNAMPFSPHQPMPLSIFTQFGTFQLLHY